MAGRFCKSVMLVRVLDGPSSGLGLESAVCGKIPLDSVIKADPALPRVTTTRLYVDNPELGQLFAEDKLDLLFAPAVRLARLGVVDAPAILSSVTAAALAPRTSGVLLVIRAEKTRATNVERARRVIERGGGRILGVVLNKDRASPDSEVDGRWQY